MKIVILDRLTLGKDLDISGADKFGEVIVYDKTEPYEVKERIKDADAVFVNKLKLNRDNLKGADNLKIICEAATGYDNIDLEYCRENNIAVCNVPAYSVYSVAQVTVSMVLSLVNHLKEYNKSVSDGTYSNGKTANILTPVYHELYKKKWGIIGYGAIGKRVGEIAKALGCEIMAFKRTPEDGVYCTDIDTLVENCDIISIHIPLSPETKGLISRERIEKMRDNVIIVNTARGLVTDERALCDGIKSGKIGGLGVDVYSIEPFPIDSPFYEIKDFDNVCLTPHMAWGAIEARERCFSIMLENLAAFLDGEIKNRVEL